MRYAPYFSVTQFIFMRRSLLQHDVPVQVASDFAKASKLSEQSLADLLAKLFLKVQSQILAQEACFCIIMEYSA